MKSIIALVLIIAAVRLAACAPFAPAESHPTFDECMTIYAQAEQRESKLQAVQSSAWEALASDDIKTATRDDAKADALMRQFEATKARFDACDAAWERNHGK